jgi:hypothetical protein
MADEGDRWNQASVLGEVRLNRRMRAAVAEPSFQVGSPMIEK